VGEIALNPLGRTAERPEVALENGDRRDSKVVVAMLTLASALWESPAKNY